MRVSSQTPLPSDLVLAHNSMSAKVPMPAKQEKARIACTNCKQRKTRCTLETNGKCKKCNELGKDCTFRDTRRQATSTFQAQPTPSALEVGNRGSPTGVCELTPPEPVLYDWYVPVFINGSFQPVFNDAPCAYTPEPEPERDPTPWTSPESYLQYLRNEAIASVIRPHVSVPCALPSMYTVQALNYEADGLAFMHVNILGSSVHVKRQLRDVVTTTPLQEVQDRILAELEPQTCYMTIGCNLPRVSWIDYWLLYQVNGANRICTTLGRKPESVFEGQPRHWDNEHGYHRYVHCWASQAAKTLIGVHKGRVQNFDLTPTTMYALPTSYH
ncbi:uncharacterized protein PG998_000773 [Apiospora kogelbergensis]|uniref:uncharacterized protein n=1 Tax=Apiospora kogelbergensis TaxID=1337665 RepID=UPI0031325B1D